MVSAIMGFGRSGLQDWYLQRITAVYMLVAGIAFDIHYFFYFEPSYDAWRELFSCALVQWATLLFFVSVLVHAWIGLWTVSTDYIKVTFLRLVVQTFINLSLIVQFLWVVKILFF